MLNQYSPQRFRYAYLSHFPHRPIRVGTIPIGTICRLPRRCTSQFDTVIVEGWYPREIDAARKVNGKYVSSFVLNGGHLALVRSLRNGKRYQVAEQWLATDD